jgi:intergrase/recombinase
MHLTRKIFDSWLHKSGISDITIDMLSGRVPKSVLAQHYIRPDATLRTRY